MSETPVRHVDTHTLAEAAARIQGAPLVAIDTEFHAETRFLPQLFLVQIAIPDAEVWIVDPLVPGLLQALGPALRATPWVVHAGKQDLRLLDRELGGLPDRIFDTQIAAGLVSEHYPASLSSLCHSWLDLTLSKAERMSDWSHRPLDADQVRYAAADATLLPGLWSVLAARAQELGRTEVVLAACADLAADAVRDDDEAWRELARGIELSAVEAGALRALVQWRLGRARTEDRPATFVLGDPTLRQIARALPRTRADLSQNRRMSPKTIDRHGGAILGAIAGAVADPSQDQPTTISPGTAQARMVAWLELLGQVDGHAGQFAARLALPWRAADALVREITAAADRDLTTRDRIARSLGSWRDALVGNAVAAAFEGRSSLCLQAGDVASVPVSHNMRKSRST